MYVSADREAGFPERIFFAPRTRPQRRNAACVGVFLRPLPYDSRSAGYRERLEYDCYRDISRVDAKPNGFIIDTGGERASI